MKRLNFTPENVVIFCQLYNDAVDKGYQSFSFENCELVTEYARFVIVFIIQKGLIIGYIDDKSKKFIGNVDPTLN